VKRGTRPPKATNPTLHKYNFKNKKYIFSKLSLKRGKKNNQTTNPTLQKYKFTNAIS